ncbi:MAG: hypothetical protein E6902_02370 [Paeniclostridium sordellii]|nr:hypothetical protein [Paeniclostridium sordellii]
MSCENCGLNNFGCKNYCKLDGRDLTNLESINIEFGNKKTCSKCGESENKNSIYCKSCGNDLTNITKVKEYTYNNLNSVEKDVNIKLNIKRYLEKINIRNKLLTAMGSIILLIVISGFVKIMIGAMGLDINEYLNPFSIALGLNLIPINVLVNSFMGVANINISMGIIIYSIVPILCVVLSSTIFIKKDCIDKENIIKDSIILSIIYGLILGIVSILGRKYIMSPISEYYSMSIAIKYSFIKSILNGIIISFLPTYMVLFNKLKPKNNKLKVINKALKTIGVLYLIVLVFLTISLFSTNIFGDNKDLAIFIKLTQLSIYLLQLVNFVPIVISNTIISIFNIGDVSLYVHESMKLFIYAIILLTLVILIVSGYDIKNKFKNKGVIKYFSLVYSIVIGCTIYLSKIDTSGSLSLLEVQNYGGYSYIGSSVVVGIVISFLYSYAILYLGYKLNKE